MAAAAVPAKKRGRGRVRLIVALVVVVLIVVGLIIGLNIAASAATPVGATLTSFVPSVSVSRAGGAFATASSGTIVDGGDSVRTDAKGRAQIKFPDGSITRMAQNSLVTLTGAHFSKDGNLHDSSIIDKLGRTLSTVQKLAGGASYQVQGNSTTASVRGTIFEVFVHADGSLVIKLFKGGLDVDGKSHVHLTEGQQVLVDAQGNIGIPGPILPDPDDPFTGEIAADEQAEAATTPGTEQDFVGAPLHNGEQQQFTYSFAGGSDIKAALAYPGSTMELKIEAPDGKIHTKTGISPVVIVIVDPPAGIYKIDVIGVSGLGPNGETPYVAIASLEPCQTSNINQNGAVRKSYSGADLAGAVSVSGLSNLQVSIVGSSSGGAFLTGSANYNGASIAGALLLFTHGGRLGIIALAASIFGLNVPAQQAAQQIASALGQDPLNVDLGFNVERLFACDGVLMMDGRTGAP